MFVDSGTNKLLLIVQQLIYIKYTVYLFSKMASLKVNEIINLSTFFSDNFHLTLSQFYDLCGLNIILGTSINHKIIIIGH